MIRTIQIISLTSAFFVSVAQHGQAQITKTMIRLPDTGQTQSFTETPGEDADYTIHPPFFVVNGDGTATDTVTGLMWQQTDGGEMTFESAVAYCQNLQLGGFDDWRLPTAQEAFSMLHHGVQNPPLNTTVFPVSQAEYWWTGEYQAGSTSKIWVTNAGGGIGNHPKTETLSAGGNKRFHVRAVRDIFTPVQVTQQFDIQDSTVVDKLTGLEWQRFPSPDSMNWENALHRAEMFVLKNQSDWRLPNVKELESLNDETRTHPSIHLDAFPEIGSGKYWTSTSLPNQPTQAWFMDTNFGVVSHELKTLQNHLLLVRGPLENTTHTTTTATMSFNVFPNPFYNRIHVENLEKGSEEQVEAALSDCLGNLVFFGKNIENQDFTHLLPGLYFLQIKTSHAPILRLIKL